MNIRAAFLLLGLLLPALPAHADAPVVEDGFSPHQGAQRLVLSVIRSARRSIDVAAYSFTSKRIAWALVDAVRRGVAVRMVLDPWRGGPHNLAAFLTQHGVKVRINHRYAIMHDKFMVIDDRIVELGSFNYTWAAATQNAENVLVLRGEPQIVRDYDSQWQKLWNEAKAG